MKERPILFSGPMVRAILDGRKTQTRRVVKLTDSGRVQLPGSHKNWHLDDPNSVLACPYGQPGDRLWVRETFCYKIQCGEYITTPDGNYECYYRATEVEHITKDDGSGGTEYCADGREASPWQPSIYMPRWASRITLEITGVRAELLQDISEDDCLAEGAITEPDSLLAVKRYKELWNSIHGPGAWDANPWVWVITFKKAEEKCSS